MQSQKSFQESAEFIRGRNGEQIVARVLQRQGWFVVPSYDYCGDDNNKAPKLQGVHANYVLPDLDVCKEGNRRWAEVKTKGAPTFTRNTRQFDHGIDRHHYEQYLEVQRITGTPVFLVIYEEQSGCVLWASLDELEPYKRFSDKFGRGGMIYWPRERFKQLCKLPPKRKSEDVA